MILCKRDKKMHVSCKRLYKKFRNRTCLRKNNYFKIYPFMMFIKSLFFGKINSLNDVDKIYIFTIYQLSMEAFTREQCRYPAWQPLFSISYVFANEYIC